MDFNLSIIIPARNEEENIEETIKSIARFLNNIKSEIIVVNDHSTDKTEETVKNISHKNPFVRVINNEKPPGFANALFSGFENARGKFVLPVMADGCDEPETILLMLKKMDEGYDLVCGSRYIKDGGKYGGPKIQGFFSTFVGKSLHYLIRIPTMDISNAFKMYRRDVLLSMKIKEKGFAISMEAALKFYFLGYKITEVPTIWYGRKKGKSKFRLTKTFPYIRLYFDAIIKMFSILYK